MARRFLYLKPEKDPVLPVKKDNPKTVVEKDKFPLAEIIERTAKYCGYHMNVAETEEELQELRRKYGGDKCFVFKAHVVAVDEDGTSIVNIDCNKIVFETRCAFQFLNTMIRLLG